jgi:hypothetical protein
VKPAIETPYLQPLDPLDQLERGLNGRLKMLRDFTTEDVAELQRRADTARSAYREVALLKKMAVEPITVVREPEPESVYDQIVVSRDLRPEPEPIEVVFRKNGAA